VKTGRRGRLDSEFFVISMDTSKPKDFESALAELEAIVASMEGGQMPLSESLAAYKRGAALVAYCQSALQDAQQQIEILEKGVLKPFAPNGGDDGS
jgi:exodeoxyribonuclease VII small subunit